MNFHLNIAGSACDFEVYLALVQKYCINIKMVNIFIIRFEVFDQWISDFGNKTGVFFFLEMFGVEFWVSNTIFYEHVALC